MTTKILSCNLFGINPLPLRRQTVLMTRGSAAAGSQLAVGNMDDLARNERCESVSDTAASVRFFEMSSEDVIQELTTSEKLPTSLSKLSRKSLYSDSRHLEIESTIFLQNHFLTSQSETVDDVPDSEGFVVVKSGFKPPSEAPKDSSVSFRPDFYKFQVKERKMKEWQAEKSRKATAECDVSTMAKRRRFQLEYILFCLNTTFRLLYEAKWIRYQGRIVNLSSNGINERWQKSFAIKEPVRPKLRQMP